jgi:hypothetical protein
MAAREGSGDGQPISFRFKPQQEDDEVDFVADTKLQTAADFATKEDPEKVRSTSMPILVSYSFPSFPYFHLFLLFSSIPRERSPLRSLRECQSLLANKLPSMTCAFCVTELLRYLSLKNSLFRASLSLH